MSRCGGLFRVCGEVWKGRGVCSCTTPTQQEGTIQQDRNEQEERQGYRWPVYSFASCAAMVGGLELESGVTGPSKAVHMSMGQGLEL